MTKKQIKESQAMIEKVWEIADRSPLVGGKQDCNCTITYVNMYKVEVTEKVKYVRWDGAVITESNHHIWADLERVLSVAE